MKFREFGLVESKLTITFRGPAYQNKQKFLFEIKHYFPGIIKIRKNDAGENEYYIDGRLFSELLLEFDKALKIIDGAEVSRKFLKVHDFMRAKM